MHLVAIADALGDRWRWQIVDQEGNEIAVARLSYASLVEALEAGRVRYEEVMRRVTPQATRARGIRYRRSA
jgi:hypothetical protein